VNTTHDPTDAEETTTEVPASELSEEALEQVSGGGGGRPGDRIE